MILLVAAQTPLFWLSQVCSLGLMDQTSKQASKQPTTHTHNAEICLNIVKAPVVQNRALRAPKLRSSDFWNAHISSNQIEGSSSMSNGQNKLEPANGSSLVSCFLPAPTGTLSAIATQSESISDWGRDFYVRDTPIWAFNPSQQTGQIKLNFSR